MRKQDFYSTKIRVDSPEHSEKIQKKLHELGIHWGSRMNTIDYTDSYALFIWAQGFLAHGDEQAFNDSKFGIITMQDLFPVDLNNISINIDNQEESRIVQEKLFKFGYSWCCGDKSFRKYNNIRRITTGSHHTFGYGKESGLKLDDKYVSISFYEFLKLVNEEKKMDFRIEVKKMELKDMKQKNLEEAKKQIEEEKKNEEIETAKKELRHAIDQINRLDRNIKMLNEEKAPHLETLKVFEKKK